jgi:threonine dehydrogenase-like Zn-dependent dehydrogenase
VRRHDVIDMNDFTTSEARVRRVKELTYGRGDDIVVEVVGIAAATVEGPEQPAGCSKGPEARRRPPAAREAYSL